MRTRGKRETFTCPSIAWTVSGSFEFKHIHPTHDTSLPGSSLVMAGTSTCLARNS